METADALLSGDAERLDVSFNAALEAQLKLLASS
jgi:hypothetical protein